MNRAPVCLFQGQAGASRHMKGLAYAEGIFIQRRRTQTMKCCHPNG